MIIILLASASLVGIVLTQLFWVGKAFELKENQFDNGVRISMKSVLNRLHVHTNDSVFRDELEKIRCSKLKLDVTDIVDAGLLDSLIEEELDLMLIDNRYYYAIYNKINDRFIAGDFDDFENELLDSKFQFSLESLYQPGDYYLSIYFPGKKYLVIEQMNIWVVLSVIFLIVLLINFVYVIYTLFRQKKLSEVKNDFINNLTHELKTPIATSSLAAEMLLRPEIEKEPKKIQKYAKVILDENSRLQEQVEQVLQIAALETGSLQYRSLKVDVHQLIKNVLNIFEIKIRENNIDIEVHLEARDYFIIGDREHLQNVFSNLVDNAIKYSPIEPRIKIRSWNIHGGIMLRIEDNGIGIRKEHQKYIFKKLYRVPTGNIHEARGFGLGLYYVKTVVDHHNGRIGLNSQPGTGSVFNVFLPFKTQ
ncbi:MAG: HAMP domain-containing histidine kinase [Bacteroidetes bacterium]|nr:HAMP domain-containing histidine kinase [Bacteroidota bacterium]